jgi:hypothetical protein
LSPLHIQLQFLGNSLADNADGSASVQDELEMGLVPDLAFNLNEVPRRKPERQ